MLRSCLLIAITLLITNFAQAKSNALVCHYPIFGSEAGLKKYGKSFELKLRFDVQSGYATLIGEGGTAKLKMIKSRDKGSLTFIEITPSGNVMTLTVDAHDKSVYSRNTTISGKLNASQSYGTCRSL